MSESLQSRIALLEDTVSDLKDALDLAQQEYRNELDAMRAKVEAIESYREEQLARAIAQHEMDKLTEQMAAAKRRQAVFSSLGNVL